MKFLPCLGKPEHQAVKAFCKCHWVSFYQALCIYSVGNHTHIRLNSYFCVGKRPDHHLQMVYEFKSARFGKSDAKLDVELTDLVRFEEFKEK